MDAKELYEAYHQMVFRYLWRLSGSEALADELTQETFYQAVRQLDRFRGESGGGTWLCGIAKRLYASAMRKPQSLSLEEAPESPQPDFVEALCRKDQAMTAQRALHHLPEPYREVFTLRTFCEMSHEQIGQLFGKSDTWARVTYYRARGMLVQAMKETET